ncbi:MAG TPA: 2-phosphosulfolactate phosphatase [Candidatus Dormibacteraeota bacterium]
MEVIVQPGLEGAARARGVAVVIDVFRAFTVSAYALAGGAAECLLVRDVDDAVELARQVPNAVVSAEVDGKPIPGIPISNSPAQVAELDWRGRTLVQRTSAGTQGAAAAAESADVVMAASLVVAGATAAAVRHLRPDLVTLVTTGATDHVEDAACAELLRALLLGEPADSDSAVERIRRSERYALLADGSVPGFPRQDLDLALAVDRFDFAQRVTVEAGVLHLRAEVPSAG